MPGSRLSRSSSDPLYRQIVRDLQQRIRSGELPDGAQLESEQELMRRYQVSRITLRQATAVLQKAGLLKAHRGRGTFVHYDPLLLQNDSFDAGPKGFYEMLVDSGFDAEARLLTFSLDPNMDDNMNPNREELPARIDRLFSADGQPIALAGGFVPREIYELGREHVEATTYFRMLEDLGREVVTSEVSISVRPPTPRAAQLLNLNEKVNCLRMLRTSYDAEGRICEHMIAEIVPDRFELSFQFAGAMTLTSVLKVQTNAA
jgi:GntR family transcriptional regulator